MKAVVLFGGTGSRVNSLSKGENKALISVNNKPSAYYVLKNLVSHFSEVLIITTPKDLTTFQDITSTYFAGFKFSFKTQPTPSGVAHALSYSKTFLEKDEFFSLILGDFYSEEIPKILDAYKKEKGSYIVLNKINDPKKYGVFDFKRNKIVEKPDYFVSDYAVRGFYILNSNCLDLIPSLKKNRKDELEITDLLNLIGSLHQVEIQKVFDLGSVEGIEDFKAHLTKQFSF